MYQTEKTNARFMLHMAKDPMKWSSQRTTSSKVSSSIIVGNRIPREFFVTKGKGESDITIHAGSYHLALRDAGIEMANIMTYSSILPAIATEIEKPDITHGEVMETIMAVCNSEKGQLCTAGIIYGILYDKKTGQKYGGLVCEHYGQITEEEVENRLRASLNELYINGYSEDFEMREIRVLKNSFTPQKKHGTSLVALCFKNYMIPVIG